MSTKEMEEKFRAYDFENDEKWQNLLRNIEIVGPNAATLLLARKRKYYKQDIDTNYEAPPPPKVEKVDMPPPTPSSTSSSSSSSSSASSSGQGSGYGYGYGAGQGYGYGYGGMPTSALYGAMGTLEFLVNSMVLSHVVLYVLPLLGEQFAYAAYYRTILLGIASALVSLFSVHGRPQMNTDYLARVMRDETSHVIFGTFMFYSSEPSFMGVFPVLLRCGMIFLIKLQQMVPFLSGPLNAVTSKRHLVGDMIAQAEVYTGVVLVVFLATPNRNIMLLFIYWQYLRMRHVLSTCSQRAFSQFARTVETYLPGMVQPLWEKLKAYAWTYVDPAELQKQQEQAQSGAADGGSGLMSKCAIM